MIKSVKSCMTEQGKKIIRVKEAIHDFFAQGKKKNETEVVHIARKMGRSGLNNRVKGIIGRRKRIQYNCVLYDFV